MEEFLNKLYNYEYFGTYLMISIAVLVLLFIIVLVFGKKDQKEREIEETKRIQQIKDDAFKEEGTPQVLEAKEIEAPVPDEMPVMNNEPSIPVVNETKEEVADDVKIAASPVVENLVENPVVNEIPNNVVDNSNNANINNVEVEVPEVNIMPEPPKEVPLENVNVPSLNNEVNNNVSEPVLSKEEEKPFAFTNEEIPVSTIPEVEVPAFNYDEVVNKATEEKPVMPKQEVFSSVYVKEEVKEEKEKEKEEEEEEIELPTLKKDVEVEKPELKDYDLNSLSGETYDIK